MNSAQSIFPGPCLGAFNVFTVKTSILGIRCNLWRIVNVVRHRALVPLRHCAWQVAADQRRLWLSVVAVQDPGGRAGHATSLSWGQGCVTPARAKWVGRLDIHFVDRFQRMDDATRCVTLRREDPLAGSFDSPHGVSGGECRPGPEVGLRVLYIASLEWISRVLPLKYSRSVLSHKFHAVPNSSLMHPSSRRGWRFLPERWQVVPRREWIHIPGALKVLGPRLRQVNVVRSEG
mmetsp:Transcript_70546/g.127206  ORF Transcript_70546/g.127206 Transcript_70546/m.127206 type:complete len:233 (-) Transcript_70546:425-1123(-)